MPLSYQCFLINCHTGGSCSSGKLFEMLSLYAAAAIECPLLQTTYVVLSSTAKQANRHILGAKALPDLASTSEQRRIAGSKYALAYVSSFQSQTSIPEVSGRSAADRSFRAAMPFNVAKPQSSVFEGRQ